MGKDLVLPKNIRQIGDIQGEEKIYMEDYVMTYIRKMEAQEERGSVGLLLGERCETQDGVFVFVRGILDVPQDNQEKKQELKERRTAAAEKKGKQRCGGQKYIAQDASEESARQECTAQNIAEEDVRQECTAQNIAEEGARQECTVQNIAEEDARQECTAQNIAEEGAQQGAAGADTAKETETAQGEEAPLTLKEKIHRARIEYFPGWDVQGCCVIGKYRPEQFEELSGILPDAQQLIYHLQEQEETLYWKSQGQYSRIKGYFVFYEQNRRMQEYLSEVFRDATVEQESLPERAIKNFRQKVREKGEQKTGSILKLASSFFVATVLVAGALVVDRVEELRSVRNVAGINSDVAKEQWDLEYTKERMLAQQEEAEAAAMQGLMQGDAAVQTAAEGQKWMEETAIEGRQPEVDAADIYAEDAEQAAAMQEQGTGVQGADVQDQSTGIQDQSAGVQDQNAGAQNQSAGIQDQSVGVQDQNAGAQDQSAGIEEQSTGAQDQSTGMEGQSTGVQSAGAQDQSTGEQNQNAGMQGTGAQEQNIEAASTVGENQSADLQPGAAEQTETDVLDAAWMGGSDSFWEDEAQEASVRSTQASYVIKAGDTLASICKQYYGSIDRVSQLCEANQITDANTIMPGQKIVLP